MKAKLFLPFVALFLSTLALSACSSQEGLKVYPKRGPYIGGDQVRITGAAFKQSMGVKVYFGKVVAENPVITEEAIVVVAPAGKNGETVDIEIVFDEATTYKIPQSYTYYDPTDIEKKTE
jgi:IPT/TIG domain